MKRAVLAAIACITSIGLAERVLPRAVEFPANATEIFGPYVHDDGILGTWMSKHPGDTSLALLNIPGTHDSATWNYTQATQDALLAVTADDGEGVYPPEFFRCQGASIIASLNAGVRFFDLRYALDPAGTKLVFWHSMALLSEVATVGDVVAAFYYWLDRHPSEAVILSLQYESSTIADAASNSTDQSLLFDILNSTAAARYIEQTHDALPTLGEARGKVVLFKRFDLGALPAEYGEALPGLHLSPALWTDDGPDIALTYNKALNLTAFIEDYYEPELSTSSSASANIAAKVNATEAHLRLATSGHPSYAHSLFITFASAEHVLSEPVATTPEIMAVGADNSSTPLGGVNQQILPILNGYRGDRVGIVVLDFWDQPRDLISRILGW